MSIRISSDSNRRWFILIILSVLFLIFVALDSFAIYSVFSARYPGAVDFYPLWNAARALTREGRNPYDLSVAQEAQLAMRGRLMPPTEDQAALAYPLYVIFFFWPLTFISYPAAQAVWMAMMQFALLAGVILCMRTLRWQPPLWLVALTIFWSMFFYPATRALILGQVATLVFALSALALWALSERRDTLAGISLAMSTIKPHLVLPLVLLLLLYGAFKKRWAFVSSFSFSMVALAGLALLWVPSWPLDFLHNSIIYVGYQDYGSPVANLLDCFVPDTMLFLEFPLSIMLLILMASTWLALWRSGAGSLFWAVSITLIVSNLVALRSGSANHVMLFLPLFVFFYRLDSNGTQNWLIALLQVFLSVLLWMLFLTTKGDDFEPLYMHGLLPALLLVVYLLDRRNLQKTTRSIEAAS